jgi:hypothetical protein
MTVSLLWSREVTLSGSSFDRQEEGIGVHAQMVGHVGGDRLRDDGERPDCL